jgi:hypothetical protein
MKSTMFLRAAIAVCLSLSTLMAAANPGIVKPFDHCKHLISGKAVINLRGPSDVSYSGGPYTYAVRLYGVPLEPGSKWIITDNGIHVAEFPAYQSGSEAIITLYGSDFLSTGTKGLFLIGFGDGFPAIIASKSISVTP